RVCSQLLLFFLAYSSTYRSANSANVPAPRSALRSAAGSLPSATASLILAAIRRASLSPTSPMWYHRGRPRREETNLNARRPVGGSRSTSPRSFSSHTLIGVASVITLRTNSSVRLRLFGSRDAVPSFLGRPT